MGKMGQILEVSDKMFYGDINYNLYEFDAINVLKKFGVKFLNSNSYTHEIELPLGWLCVANNYLIDEYNYIRGYIRYNIMGHFVIIPKYRVFFNTQCDCFVARYKLDTSRMIVNHIPCGPTFSTVKEAENCLYKGCPIYKTDDIYSILTSYWNEEIYFN